MMKTGLLALVMVVGLASGAAAQGTATTGNKLAWDQPNATLTEAQGFVYKQYADGATTGVVLTGVTCSGTTTITCQTAFPAYTPGNHSVTVTASAGSVESLKSTPLAFQFIVVPSAPANVRIQEDE